MKLRRGQRTDYQMSVLTPMSAFWDRETPGRVYPPTAYWFKKTGVVWLAWFHFEPSDRTRHAGLGAMLDWAQEHDLLVDFVRPIDLSWWECLRGYLADPWKKILVVQIPPDPV
jgi:hypothetical protein